MKARKSHPSQKGPLNQRLNRRLLSYATAATAAGVGVLGLAQTAEAQVVFTPAHVMIGSHTSYNLDLTNNGTTDFVLHGSVTANCSTLFDALLAKPALSNAVQGAIYNGLNVAKALAPGRPIGSSQRFVSQGNGGVLMGEAIYSPGGGQYRGNWVHVLNRYLGLKFQINGETHFGWARLSVKMFLGKPFQALLSGYAYETQPNTPITAGQTTGDDAAVPAEPKIEPGPGAALRTPGAPQPASLGMLALGSSGLALWRHERAAAL
jgi:hypothetical protein